MVLRHIKAKVSQCRRPTMIYDPPRKGVCRFLCIEVFISPREARPRGIYRLGGNFHRRVTSIIFSMARAYIISSLPLPPSPLSLDNYLDALFIALLSYRCSIEQFYYCSHHSCFLIIKQRALIVIELYCTVYCTRQQMLDSWRHDWD